MTVSFAGLDSFGLTHAGPMNEGTAVTRLSPPAHGAAGARRFASDAIARSGRVIRQEATHPVLAIWQEFGWGGGDEAGPQTESSIERGFRPRGPVDEEWGRSDSLDPDRVGDIADEGTGHRG